MPTSSYQNNFYNTLLSGSITTNPDVTLPTPKQKPIHLAWLKTMLQPLQRLNDLNYIYYDYGSSYSFYSASTTYSIGSRINGNLAYNNAVFECVTASTTGTFSTTNWLQILPTFIGYEDRLKFVNSRVVFEWALNKNFRTTFRQPNVTDTVKSDIYISDNSPNLSIFLIGPDDFSSSFISVADSTAYGSLSSNVWMGPDPSIYPITNYTYNIYITATAYAGFPGYNGLSHSADFAVRRFADTINYTGLPYSISTY